MQGGLTSMPHKDFKKQGVSCMERYDREKMLFRAIKRETVCNKIVAQFKRKIKNGDLQPGEKLPGERDLAQMFDVGRSSIREALVVLDSIGLIKKTPEGSYISEDIGRNEARARHKNIIDEQYYEKLYEARILIEMATVELAAQNGDPEDFALLDDILAEMSKMKDDIERLAQLDVDFHTHIAYASKNEFLAEDINMIGDVLRKQIVEYMVRTKNEDFEITMKEHTDILEAIKNRDPVTAKREISNHLGDAKKIFI
jgi:GntR family transcriptional repressor for pyruvate dehydrogenase complex